MITTATDRATRGSIGGSRQTPAQVAARKAMQAARRGKPVHPVPDMWGNTRTKLRSLRSRSPLRGGMSYRAIATELGVSDRTVRRWLAGIDIPAPVHVRGLSALAGRRLK